MALSIYQINQLQRRISPNQRIYALLIHFNSLVFCQQAGSTYGGLEFDPCVRYRTERVTSITSL